jgi:hypothetical protein
MCRTGPRRVARLGRGSRRSLRERKSSRPAHPPIRAILDARHTAACEPLRHADGRVDGFGGCERLGSSDSRTMPWRRRLPPISTRRPSVRHIAPRAVSRFFCSLRVVDEPVATNKGG